MNGLGKSMGPTPGVETSDTTDEVDEVDAGDGVQGVDYVGFVECDGLGGVFLDEAQLRS